MQAVARLEAALTRLEAAVQLRAGADRSVEALLDDRARLERDRADLAARLDAAEARVKRLREANQEVANRLVAVMERVRRIDPGAARQEGEL
jgi:chromosome segregation ATPase